RRLVLCERGERSRGVVLTQCLDELVDGLEVAIDGGEPYVVRVDRLLETLHDHLADLPGRDLVLGLPVQLVLDLVDHRLDLGGGDRTLGAGEAERTEQLAPVVRFRRAVALQHDDLSFLDVLVRREPPMAAKTLAPPTHRPAFPAGTRVDDAIFGFVAVGAAHLRELHVQAESTRPAIIQAMGRGTRFRPPIIAGADREACPRPAGHHRRSYTRLALGSSNPAREKCSLAPRRSGPPGRAPKARGWTRGAAREPDRPRASPVRSPARPRTSRRAGTARRVRARGSRGAGRSPGTPPAPSSSTPRAASPRRPGTSRPRRRRDRTTAPTAAGPVPRPRTAGSAIRGPAAIARVGADSARSAPGSARAAAPSGAVDGRVRPAREG